MLLTLLVLYTNRAGNGCPKYMEGYTLNIHEYLRDTLSFRYQECKSCRNRTELTCIKCGFCYSSHWKKEELEKKKKIQSKPLITKVKYSYSSIPSSSTKTMTMMMTTTPQSGESVSMQQQHHHQNQQR